MSKIPIITFGSPEEYLDFNKDDKMDKLFDRVLDANNDADVAIAVEIVLSDKFYRNGNTRNAIKEKLIKDGVKDIKKEVCDEVNNYIEASKAHAEFDPIDYFNKLQKTPTKKIKINNYGVKKPTPQKINDDSMTTTLIGYCAEHNILSDLVDEVYIKTMFKEAMKNGEDGEKIRKIIGEKRFTEYFLEGLKVDE